MDSAEEKWARNLRLGIKKNIVPVIEPGQKEVDLARTDLIVDDERMKIWREVFTDPAVSSSNYEPYETYGDFIAGCFIIKLSMNQFPGVTSDELTSLVSHYASNELQGKLMEGFEVKRALRGKPAGFKQRFVEAYMLKPDPSTGMELTSAIYGDMYEAILGAICVVGDSIENGLGMIYAARWFQFIFTSKVTLDRKKGRGDPCKIVDGLFSRFDFYNPGGAKFVLTKRDKKKMDTVSSVEVSYSFSSSLVEFLKGLPPTLFSSSKKKLLPEAGVAIVVVEGETKEEAKEQACSDLLDKLKEYGITEEWAEKVKTALDLEAVKKDPSFTPYYEKVDNYLKKNGFSNLRFKILYKHSKEGNRQGLMVIADDEDGNATTLLTRLYEVGSRYVARKEAIKDLASQLNL